MICLKCTNEGVLSDAGLISSILYYYCRTCKEEIELEVVLKANVMSGAKLSINGEVVGYCTGITRVVEDCTGITRVVEDYQMKLIKHDKDRDEY